MQSIAELLQTESDNTRDTLAPCSISLQEPVWDYSYPKMSERQLKVAVALETDAFTLYVRVATLLGTHSVTET